MRVFIQHFSYKFWREFPDAEEYSSTSPFKIKWSPFVATPTASVRVGSEMPQGRSVGFQRF